MFLNFKFPLQFPKEAVPHMLMGEASIQYEKLQQQHTL